MDVKTAMDNPDEPGVTIEELVRILATVNRVNHQLFLAFSISVLSELPKQKMVEFARSLSELRIQKGTQE